MAGNQTQISAFVSRETKEMVDEYVEAHGVKKAHLVEQALLHHMKALRELPPDVIIPPRIVLSGRSFRKVTSRIRNPRKPTAALRRLLSGR